MSKHGKEHAYGPYPHRARWRVVVVRADGTRDARSFESEAEAHAIVTALRNATNARTIGDAVRDYLDSLRESVRPSSLVTARHRLTAFLRLSEGDRLLRTLKPHQAAQLYARRTNEVTPATHRGELSLVQRWGAHCVRRGWLAVSPFEGIEPVGTPSTGKPQLRVTEARTLLGVLLADPSPEATAVLMSLLMGLRAHEVIERVARDVDDGARLLWIPKSKTAAGVRQLAIPSALRLRLLGLLTGLAPQDPVFPGMTRHALHYHTVRFARLAGVPRVTPHGLRGTFATLSVTGELPSARPEALAPQFGHSDGGATMRRHYLAPGAEESANARRLESVLAIPEETGEQTPLNPFPGPHPEGGNFN